MAALTRAEVLEARAHPFIPEGKAGAGRIGKLIQGLTRRRPEPVGWPPRKEDAPCCQANLDDLGRPPVGFCGPDCIRRPAVWRTLTQGDDHG